MLQGHTSSKCPLLVEGNKKDKQEQEDEKEMETVEDIFQGSLTEHPI